MGEAVQVMVPLWSVRVTGNVRRGSRFCSHGSCRLTAELQIVTHLFIFREGGRRERNIDQLPLACPQLGTWPATQARALTGNGPGNPLVRRPAVLSPLSTPVRAPDLPYTSRPTEGIQGSFKNLDKNDV